MKKYNEFLKEDLTGALVEPQSDSAQEAKRLGLQYVGFGRYEDPRSQQVTHIVQNGKLVPFNRAVKTNTFKKTSGDDFGSYSQALKPEIDQHHADLVGSYPPENYPENELAAIETYTGGAYADINSRLASLPTGIPAEQIEPDTDQDTTPFTIAALDSALSRVPAPKDFLAYVSLSANYQATDIAPGQTYAFKSYRSMSLDPNVAMNFDSNDQQVARRKQTVVIQVHVKKGSKGMYVDDYSSTPGEGEFLLPRGSSMKIVSGPSKLVGSNGFTGEMNHQVVLFTAELIKSK